MAEAGDLAGREIAVATSTSGDVPSSGKNRLVAFVLLGLLSVVTCLVPLSSVEATTVFRTQYDFPIVDTFFLPCPGVNEAVDFSGVGHVIEEYTSTGRITQFGFQTNLQDVKGIGETTGTTFVFTSNTNSMSVGGGDMASQQAFLIQQGHGVIAAFTLVFHYIGANGLTFDHLSFDGC